MLNILIIKILIILLTIVFITAFSGGETAIASIEYGDKNLELGNISLKLLSLWHRFPWRLLNAILIGNNVFVMFISVLGTNSATDFSKLTNISLEISVFIFSSLITVLVLLFADILPKSIARLYPRRYFRVVSYPIYIFEKLVWPLNKILSKFTFWTSNIFGVEIKKDISKLSDEDIQEFLDLGEIDGTIHEDEKDSLEALFSFDELVAEDIMVPRAKLDFLDREIGFENIIKEIIKLKYSRVPIYKDGFDNVIGVIFSKDILVAWENRDLILLEDLIRPAYFIPPTKKVEDLLREFKNGQYHIAIVVDEFGVVMGLITIEDILEEIVGDIWDEYDVREDNIAPRKDGGYFVNPLIELNVLDKKLKLELEDDAPDGVRTLSAYIMAILGRLPRKNEFVKIKNVSVLVKQIEKRVIKKVILYKNK
ncbi:hemolysin family protein [bacterium]